MNKFYFYTCCLFISLLNSGQYSFAQNDTSHYAAEYNRRLPLIDIESPIVHKSEQHDENKFRRSKAPAEVFSTQLPYQNRLHNYEVLINTILTENHLSLLRQPALNTVHLYPTNMRKPNSQEPPSSLCRAHP